MRTFLAALARLRRDTRGGAALLMAFSLVPIMIAIGSGIDIARAYMVKGKLQEAVDSAALAGRRAMTGDDIATAQSKVDSFMAFNFPDKLYDTSALQTKVTKPETGTVQVDATTNMPTTIMAMFGVKTIPISASGRATQNYTNVDIMLVLDTTGSMDDQISGVKKIDALKQAVDTLYQQLAPAMTQLHQQGLRMRIGILPYAATVNVGALIKAKSSSYIWQNSVPYYGWHATQTQVRTWYGVQTQTTWSYGQQTYNLGNYVAGGALGNIDGNNDFASSTWAGCIEERQTDTGIVANDSRAGAPDAAYDLDIDMIPDGSNAKMWRPYIYDPAGANSQNGGGPNTYCPAAATPLTEMTSQAQLDGYLSQLIARGSTYHDVGMIWGTRMISDGGIFGGDNPDTFGNEKVSRYVIFMSDGTMSAPMDLCNSRSCNQVGDHSIAYSAYGVEKYDRRVGALSDDDSNARHTARFLMACNAAKAKNISIWTIAFGTGPVDSLTKCATNADQSAAVADGNALIAKFAQIGRDIGPLRISK